MSKVSDVREICGDYAIDIEYSKEFTFTMFFNSRRNAETVKRCVEVDDSIPNAATAVDFVEVVRCCDCKYCEVVVNSIIDEPRYFCTRMVGSMPIDPTDYCSQAKKEGD